MRNPFAPPTARVDDVLVLTPIGKRKILALRLLGIVAVLFGAVVTLFGRYASVIAKPQDVSGRMLSITCSIIGLLIIGAGTGVVLTRRWASILWSLLGGFVAAVAQLALGSKNGTSLLLAGLWLLFVAALASLWLAWHSR